MEGGISVAGEPLLIQGAGNNLESGTEQTFTSVGTLSDPPNPPTGTYQLYFDPNGNPASVGVNETTPLAFSAGASQIQTALQTLNTVNGVGGQVTVTQSAFNAGTDEEQQITFTGFAVGDKYQLYFDPNSGTPVVGFNETPALTYSGNSFTEETNIVAALVALQTIDGVTIGGAIGAGPVGNVPGGEFADFTFENGVGDSPQPLVTVNTVLPSVGIGTASHLIVGAPSSRSFVAVFQGSFAGLLQPLLTAPTTTLATTISAPSYVVRGGTANATPIEWQSVGPGSVNSAQIFSGAGGSPLQNVSGAVTGVSVYNQDVNDRSLFPPPAAANGKPSTAAPIGPRSTIRRPRPTSSAAPSPSPRRLRPPPITPPASAKPATSISPTPSMAPASTRTASSSPIRSSAIHSPA